MAVATAVVPGVGPVLARGAVAAALLGAGGAAAGSAAVGSIEAGASQGLPADEVYVYEDALRQGRTVLLMVAEDDQAEQVRDVLASVGAETIDAARQRWWVGLRDAELEPCAPEG
jgi:hypothetical protein